MSKKHIKTFHNLIKAAANDPKRQKYQLTVDKYGQPLDPMGIPHNAAEYRDNCWDILEELRDSVVILDLLARRLVAAKNVPNLAEISLEVATLYALIESSAISALSLRELLPEDMRKDQTDLLDIQRLHYEPA